MGKISAKPSNFGALKFKTQFLNWETLIVSEKLFFLNSDFPEICNILCKTWIEILFIEDFHQKRDLFPSQAAVACQTPEALPAL